jgi:hypothetical protein
MRIPGAEEALDHVASWARRGRWKETCARTIAEHFEPVCMKAGMDAGWRGYSAIITPR